MNQPQVWTCLYRGLQCSTGSYGHLPLGLVSCIVAMSNNAKQPTPYLHCWCMHLWMGLGWRCYHPTTQTAAHTRAQYWCVCVHFSCIVHIEPVMFKADWPLMTTEDCFAVLFAPDGHTKAQRIGMQLCCTGVLTLDPSHRALLVDPRTVFTASAMFTVTHGRTVTIIPHDHPNHP